MGGYGASRIGMKHSDVFGSLYIMSPCCMSARGAGGGRGGPAGGRGANMKRLWRRSRRPPRRPNCPVWPLSLQSAAAWSPNPKKPPLYFDMPFGDAQQEVLNKWAANAPLVFVHQYIGNLKQYKAIAMDVGDQDGLRVDTGKLHDILDSYGIANILRDLSRHAHQRRGGPFPELRDAVLCQEPVLRQGL